MKIKLGKRYKNGEKVPLNQYFISYWQDGTVTIGCETKYEYDSEGNTWDLLNFEPPCKPPDPKPGEIWELKIGFEHQLMRIMEGEELQYFNGASTRVSFDEAEFIRRWEPCDDNLRV